VNTNHGTNFAISLKRSHSTRAPSTSNAPNTSDSNVALRLCYRVVKEQEKEGESNDAAAEETWWGSELPPTTPLVYNWSFDLMLVESNTDFLPEEQQADSNSTSTMAAESSSSVSVSVDETSSLDLGRHGDVSETPLLETTAKTGAALAMQQQHHLQNSQKESNCVQVFLLHAPRTFLGTSLHVEALVSHLCCVTERRKEKKREMAGISIFCAIGNCHYDVLPNMDVVVVPHADSARSVQTQPTFWISRFSVCIILWLIFHIPFLGIEDECPCWRKGDSTFLSLVAVVARTESCLE